MPWYYTGVIEIEALKKMYEWLFAKLTEEHEITIKNANPYTADEYGIYIFELIYDIKSNVSEDLETRRKRVLAYIGLQPPYTFRFLQKYLNDLVGEENYKMSINVQGNILTIVLNKALEYVRKDIVDFIFMIKPASLLLELKLDYNTLYTFLPYRFHELYRYTILGIKTEKFTKDEIAEFGSRYNQQYFDFYWRSFLNISCRQQYKNSSVINKPEFTKKLDISGTTGQRTFVELAKRSFVEISKRQEYKNVNIRAEE